MFQMSQEAIDSIEAHGGTITDEDLKPQGNDVGLHHSKNYKEPAKVNDAIITKTGQIIHTDPDDNLYAFKKLPELGGRVNGKANGSMEAMERNSGVSEKMLDRLADKIAQSLKDVKGSVINNTTVNKSENRFSSSNLLSTLTMEVT